MESEGVVPLNNKIFDPQMTNHVIDVYFFTMSPPARATLMLVKALGIKHNVKVVNVMQGDNMKPEYIQINPMHTIPAINDNGFTLWDSHVIMKYLTNQYAKDDSLYPKDPKKSAIVDQRLFFNAGTLFPRFIDYTYPILMGTPPDEAKAAKFEEALKYLDTFLENQTWLAGAFLTIADFAIISVIATAEATGQFDIKIYDNVWAWYQRARNAMAGFGYEEINQEGATMFGNVVKSKLNN